jgi:4-hydroxy 2-oxovalerate aldolase
MVKILDCTLRDGGYYTNWDFSDDFLADYCDVLRELPITYVEFGYRSPEKPGYFGRFFYMSTEDVAFCKAQLRPDQKFVLMFNLKDVTPEQVRALLKCGHEYIDIVRFACPPNALDECVECSNVVAEYGIECAINVMYLTQWVSTPQVLDKLAGAKNTVQYVSLVDSYGGCYPADVRTACAHVIAALPDQQIGFHGHDNISLGFANVLAAIEAGCGIIDTTMMGMGRGAGNAATEMLVSYLDVSEGAPARYAKLVNFLGRMEALRKEHGWGTSLPYMLSGLHNLKQGDVMDWLAKRRYAPSSIIAALRHSSGAEVDTATYPDLRECVDNERDTQRPVVIIGGGRRAVEHAHAFKRFLKHQQPIVIHSSLRNAQLTEGYDNAFICLVGQEVARKSSEAIAAISENGLRGWIVPNAPRMPESVPHSGQVYQVQASFKDAGENRLGPISDIDPLELALGAAKCLATKEVMLYGFDGYENASKADVLIMNEIQDTLDQFREHVPDVAVFSLLDTEYRVPLRSIYAYSA